MILFSQIEKAKIYLSGIWRQICLWETLTKKFEKIGRTPQLIKIYVY